MRACQKSRNGHPNKPTKTLMPVLPDDIKMSIAAIVRQFEFRVKDRELVGSCFWRAILADAVFKSCHLNSRLVAGGMLYRAGYDPMRDTLRFCLPKNNLGGYLNDHLVGHIWNEIDGEIADFSCGDWVAEAITQAQTDLFGHKLGFVEWESEAIPDEFLWQPARPLKSAWKTHGEPKLGRIWYTGWDRRRSPDFTRDDGVIEMATPSIENYIEELRIRERIADFRADVELEDAV